MKIRTKLILGVFCSCLTVLLVGAISYRSFQQIQEKNQQVRMADTITDSVFELNVFTSEYLLYREKRPRIQWETQYHRLHRLLQEVEFTESAKQSLITTMRDTLEEIQRVFSDLTSSYSIQPAAHNEQLTQHLRNRLQSQLLLEFEKMLSSVSKLKEQLGHEYLSIQRRTRWLMIVFVSGFAIVISSLGLLIARSISRPLTDLIENTETIATGDLEVHLAAETDDEIGLLSQSFTRMVEQLKTTLFSRDQLEEHVNARTAELADSNRTLGEEIAERRQTDLELQTALSEISQLKDQLEAETIYLQEEIGQEYHVDHIIGQDRTFRHALYRARDVAPLETSVLLLGETGTGKEIFAREIHRLSSHKERPLIKVNCAALSSDLIESELFGHEKGAFTGAISRKVGRFELADGTTLFLDEIAELPVDLQAKLLQVLQDGEFERVGGTRTFKVRVRIIAATNRNLEEEIRQGRFRQDLYYRLNTYQISLPPLRERMDDIPLLVKHRVAELEKKFGKRITTIPARVMQVLQAYSWPGNIRELENIIERAMIASKDTSLRLVDRLEEVPLDHPSSEKLIHTNGSSEEFQTTGLQAVAREGTLEDVEREYILRMLEKTRWKVHGPLGAAVLLDMNPSTLRSRMQKLGIHRPKS